MARPDVTGNSGNTPIFGFNDTPDIGTVTGYVGNTPVTLRGLGGGGSEPFQYAMAYTQPSGSGVITYPAGFNQGMTLPIGFPYPPGYKISDGVTPGGIFPTGNVVGAQNIKIQPPPSGSGRMKFVTILKMTVACGATAGAFSAILGTIDSSTNPDPGGSFPLWPYIGLAHDLTPLVSANVPANSALNYYLFRLDVLDNTLLVDQFKIPTWPTWQMNPNSTNLLWPGILPIFTNTGTVSLNVSNVFAIGFAC